MNKSGLGEGRRHLLWLWIDVMNGRPVAPEIDMYDNGLPGQGGIARQEGKSPEYADRDKPAGVQAH